MSKFPVVQYMVHKKDGSNELQQAMVQTDISTVHGLPEKIRKYDQFLQLLNKKDVKYIVTKQDLANYVTKDDLNKALQENKKYIDKAISNLKESLPKFDVEITDGSDFDNFTKPGIYFKKWGTGNILHAPFTGSDNSGSLIVFYNSDGSIMHLWIGSFDPHSIRMRSKGGNTSIWTNWDKIN